MPADASIYGSFRPADFGESMERGFRMAESGARLSDLARQRKMQDQEMAWKQKNQEHQDYKRKLVTVGSALESLNKVPLERRPQEWKVMRESLIRSGVAQPQDLLDVYDPAEHNRFLGEWYQQPEYLERQKSQAEIAKLRADAAKSLRGDSILGQHLTPGQKSADQTFAKDASDYYYSGGKSTVEKNFQKLEDAISTLEAKPNLTAGLSTKIPFLGDDERQDWINPDLAAVRDDIRGAIQGSLKQILGGQFTEREAQAMFSRAFNPRLSAAENVRRATAELEALRRMAGDKDAAMKYFEANGTLVGFNPSKTNLMTAENRSRDSKRGASGAWGVSEAHADGEAQKRSSPKVGEERKGFIYMGGDPAKKESWKRAR